MSTPVPLHKRIAIFVRDRGACVYCGAAYQGGAKLTADHVISRKRGGGDAYDNLVTACRDCNTDKAHFSLKAYVVELQDRGATVATTDALVARVEAARTTPIFWPAVQTAIALYREQGKAPIDDDDD